MFVGDTAAALMLAQLRENSLPATTVLEASALASSPAG
jgi:hypothetical protein